MFFKKDNKNSTETIKRNDFQGFSDMLGKISDEIEAPDSAFTVQEKVQWRKLYERLYGDFSKEYKSLAKQGQNYTERLAELWLDYKNNGNDVVSFLAEIKLMLVNLETVALVGDTRTVLAYEKNAKIKAFMEKIEKIKKQEEQLQTSQGAELEKIEARWRKLDQECYEANSAGDEDRFADLDADLAALEDDKHDVRVIIAQSKIKCGNLDYVKRLIQLIAGAVTERELEAIADKIEKYDVDSQSMIEQLTQYLKEKWVTKKPEEVKRGGENVVRGRSDSAKAAKPEESERTKERRRRYEERQAAESNSASDVLTGLADGKNKKTEG